MPGGTEPDVISSATWWARMVRLHTWCTNAASVIECVDRTHGGVDAVAVSAIEGRRWFVCECPSTTEPARGAVARWFGQPSPLTVFATYNQSYVSVLVLKCVPYIHDQLRCKLNNTFSITRINLILD